MYPGIIQQRGGIFMALIGSKFHPMFELRQISCESFDQANPVFCFCIGFQSFCCLQTQFCPEKVRGVNVVFG